MSTLSTSRIAIPALLLFGGVAPLAAALFSQYVLGYPPCPLCMLQRYPYALPAFAGLISLIPRLRMDRRLLLVGIAGWLVTAGIAAYHICIEHGWLVHEGGCSAAVLSGSVEDIRAKLMNAPLVACNIVSLRILGLSMAHWNFAAALSLCVMARSLYKQMRTV